MAKNLTNKLYVKKQLYGLQMEENIDLLITSTSSTC
jgi:hypothetical protein